MIMIKVATLLGLFLISASIFFGILVLIVLLSKDEINYDDDEDDRAARERANKQVR
jgi:hypothetical protein